jgi:hypothetical protein
MTIQSLLTLNCLFSLPLSSVIHARTFYNTEGKSIEAEMVSVENDLAVMKLTNGRVVKVAINKLSTSDQDHIKIWWKENKNLLTDSDVKLKIRQKRDYTKKPETRYSGNSKIRTSESSVTFICNLDNYSTKSVNGIKAFYTVHKRVSKRGKGSSSTEVEIIDKTMILDPLESRKDLTFTTEGVICSDSATTPSSRNNNNNKPTNTRVERSSLRETVIGVVLTLSSGGKEIITLSHPANFERLLKEEEAREERKALADDKRAESKDIADGHPLFSPSPISPTTSSGTQLKKQIPSNYTSFRWPILMTNTNRRDS